MKQENDCSSLLPSYFEEHEHEVASILLDLPLLIDQSKSSAAAVPAAVSHHSFRVVWSGKRKRSSLSRGGGVESSSPSTAALSLSPSLRETPQPRTAEEKISAGRGETKPKGKKAGSPTTPLSLSLSEEEEFGEKPPRSNRRRAGAAVSKKSRSDLMEKLAESEEQGKVLRKEIENVTRYYKILQEENSKLKAIEQQLRLGKELGKEQRRPGLTETQFAQLRAGSMVVNGNGGRESGRRKVWLVAPAPCSSSCSSSGNNNTSSYHGGGIGFDLNSESVYFPVGEGRLEQQPILGDCWRPRNATAAQARKWRRDKMNEKERRRGLIFRSGSSSSSRNLKLIR